MPASSSTPSPPIVGVGGMPRPRSRCRARRCRTRREIERLAGQRRSARMATAANWPMISRLFRVAEVHVVGQRQQLSADHGRVREASTTAWQAPTSRVRGAVAGRAVGGQRQRAVVAVQLHHRSGVGGARRASPSCRRRCCRTGPRSRRASIQIGAGDQLRQRGSEAEAILQPGRVEGFPVSASRWWADGRGGASSFSGASGMSASNLPWRRTTMRPVSVRWPITAKSSSISPEDFPRHVLTVGGEHHQRALLAFGRHELVGGHAGLARRHLGRGQARCRRCPCRPSRPRGWSVRRRHVLDGDDGVGGHPVPGRLLDQRIFRRTGRRPGRWGVSHLQIGGELGGGHGGAVDAVAASLRGRHRRQGCRRPRRRRRLSCPSASMPTVIALTSGLPS